MAIALYTFCVMYSPGPVNLIALNAGLAGFDRHLAGYCIGVGLGMFTGFAALTVAEAAFVRAWVLPWLAGIASLYILYLAWQLAVSRPAIATSSNIGPRPGVARGYLLQLLNPKGLVVILPVVTVMFPAAAIHGAWALGYAGLISLGAIGAPAVYGAGGALLGRRGISPWLLSLFNRLIALLLVIVAGTIGYDFFIAAHPPGTP